MSLGDLSVDEIELGFPFSRYLLTVAEDFYPNSL